MNVEVRSRLVALLLIPLLLYILLPMFGTVWHSVVPEHEHMLGGVAGQNAMAMAHTHAGNAACALCEGHSTWIPFTTTIHAFDPVSGLVVFAITVAAGDMLSLFVPRGLSLAVMFPALFLQSPLLLPLELPPAA